MNRLEQGERGCSGREHHTVVRSRAAQRSLLLPDLPADDIWKWGRTLTEW